MCFTNLFSLKMLTMEEKMAYAEKARKLSGKKCSQKTVEEVNTEKEHPAT